MSKFTCNICQCTISSKSKTQHLKSNKHINNVSAIFQQVEETKNALPEQPELSNEEQRKNRVREYNKKYYEKYKQEWNDYSPKICQCGLTVSSLTIHKKTKKHKEFMEILNNRSTAISSAPQSGLII